VLHRADPEFPDRLAQLGNGLRFPWWITSEVTAAKRALCPLAIGSIQEAVDVVNDRRGALAETVRMLLDQAATRWAVVEDLLADSPEALAEDATADFDEAEVVDFIPSAAGLSLRIRYDAKLREQAGSNAARRVGIWTVSGVNSDGERFAFGVITPRLTANSQFRDSLFTPANESPAALLVRGLILRRLIRRHLGGSNVSVSATPTRSERRLRKVPARPGHKLPEASMEAAVRFLRTYPDADQAWVALSSWAESSRVLMTVSEEGFKEAHRKAARFVRRAEDPERDDVNVLLPLTWDDQSRVVRVTFSRTD
jgi:hypothetical protein